MLRWIGLALAIILLLSEVEGVELTEVFYDAEGSDNNREFVEFRGAPNLTGWVIADEEANDTLTPLRVNLTHPYSLVVEEGYNTSGLTCSIYSAGSTIGNNLNNDGDRIILWNGSIVLNISFNDTAETGSSLERINNSWESGVHGGTPCAPPIIQEPTPPRSGIDLTLALPERIFAEEPVEDPFILEYDGYRSGDPARNVTVEIDCGEEWTVTVPVKRRTSRDTGLVALDPGEYECCFRIATVDDVAVEDEAVCEEVQVVSLKDVDCDVDLELELDKVLVESGTPVYFDHHLDTEYDVPFTIRYVIEDHNGVVLRNTTTTNTKRKQFTPTTDEPLMGLRFHSTLEEIGCRERGVLTDEAALLVKGPAPATPVQESRLILTAENSTGGAELPVQLAIYRGNTSQRVVKVWAEIENRRVSPTSRITLERYTEVGLKVSIPLKDGANGTGVVVAEGLGERTTMPFTRSLKQPRTPPEITSFFSRAKRLADRITLYAWLEGKGEYVYEFVTSNGSVQKNVTLDGKTRISVNATVQNDSNIYLLRIREGNETLAERSLLIEARNGRLENVERFSPREEAANESPSTINSTGEKPAPTPPEVMPKVIPKVTGHTVYSRESSMGGLKYLLGLIGATLGGIIIRRQS